MNKQPAADDFIINHQESKYSGFVSVDSYQLQHRLYSGQMSPPIVRECAQRRPAVAVITYDPAQQKVVLIRQFRIGAINNSRSPWLWECVAGLIEPNEDVLSVGRRELLEETGLTCSHIEILFDCYTSPGASNENTTICYAEVDASQAAGIHGLVEEGEDILVQSFSLDDIKLMIKNQEIYNAMTLLSMQWLILKKTK